MNLAIKDIRHNLGRFVLTTFGISLLLMLVIGMGGIYRGLVEEATLLLDRIGADLWVVQKDTRGPFAEISRIPRSVEDRVLAVPGVESASSFISHTIQREYRGRPLRLTIQGLSWPADRGQWLPIFSGRTIGQAHYEMVADKSSGLNVGDRIPLGKNIYTVVGLTYKMSSTSGDSMAFLTLTDAQEVQFDLSSEAIRNEREARVNRLQSLDLGNVQPQLSDIAGGKSSGIPALGTSMVSAVIVHVKPGCNPSSVAAKIASWPDVSVYTHAGQSELLLRGMVDKARRQLGLFRVLLIIVSAVIMALILYTLTLDKLHDIAMLKLMGARNSVILALIMQQALLLGILGFFIANLIGNWLFPLFPRRVVIVQGDLMQLAVIVLVISILASLLGIVKALRVDPGEVLS
ncbi:MAG TPA: ABC transporter permease [Lentisphaeria bacterium]|nr:MAG: ABC transporter permease [Lentisphaerae bacterium GWF2_50_93]HCE44864.1 ABC transporter permease [Lentisphaeria bacterium]